MNVNIKPVSKHHGMKENKWRGVKVPYIIDLSATYFVFRHIPTKET